MQGDSLQVSEISQQSKFCEHVLQPVMQQGSDEAALHVMRGHQPPDPRHCIICSRAHGISKPFRRSKPQLFQVQADFNDIKFNRFSQKYLVMVHSETGRLGFCSNWSRSKSYCGSYQRFSDIFGIGRSWSECRDFDGCRVSCFEVDQAGEC